VQDISIINGDCIEVLNDLSNKGIKVDCLMTDPPYNISRDTNFHTFGNRGTAMDFGKWDKGFNITNFIRHLPKVLKENSNVVIFTSWQNLNAVNKACINNNISMKRCLVLNKSNPAPFNRDRMFVNDVEFALWGVYNSKNKPTKWTFNRINKFEKCVIDTTTQSRKYHPTMKDIRVIEHLIKLLTNEGDTVLDTFLGSGTTALACKKLNRKCIGIEIDKSYCDIANERLREWQS